MALNVELIRQDIEGVRKETEDFANTAERVGGVMSEILEYSHEESERAKGVEQGLSKAVAQNAGDIKALKELQNLTATKLELEEEVKRATQREDELGEEIEYITPMAEASFRNLGALSYPEFSKDKNWKAGDLVRVGGILYILTSDYVVGQSSFDEISEQYNLVKKIEKGCGDIGEWNKELNGTISDAVDSINGDIKVLVQDVDKMMGKVVYLSQSEYEELVREGKIKEDVEYNVYEDV
jgi:hypothetical protein